MAIRAPDGAKNLTWPTILTFWRSTNSTCDCNWHSSIVTTGSSKLFFMTRKNICFASLETGFWLTLNLFELWFWCFWAFLFQSYFGRKWSEKSHDTTISAIRKCIFWQGKEAESGSQSKFGGGGLCSSESERRPREKLFNKSSLAFVEVALALISSLPKTAFLKKSFNKMDILHFFTHPTQTPFSELITVLENLTKSRIQHWERSELWLHNRSILASIWKLEVCGQTVLPEG